MNIKFFLFSFIYAVAAPVIGVKAQSGSEDTLMLHWPEYISLHDYLKPFTRADTIVDEIILPIAHEGSSAEARLLYPVKEVISVRDVYLRKNYVRGEDWSVDGRIFRLPEDSDIPFMRSDQLLFQGKKEGKSFRAVREGYSVLWDEREVFPSHQVSVTYIPDRNVPDIVYPQDLKRNSEKVLKRTRRKLKKRENLRVVFYGNSIETGGNSSGFRHQSPYMPSWPQLFIYSLRQNFLSEIQFTNRSVGGQTAEWGAEEAENRVAAHRPDLVVIGFGMNDGTGRVPVETYISRIRKIMEITRKSNPQCEFIVVTPMLANPESSFKGLQKDYRLPLWSLADRHTAIADVTVWHDWLLHYKSYQDMTGNNINHPNDYLARWYAHVLNEILIPGSSLQ